ncbi:MAG: hypothetical protein OXI92_13430 [Acidobacteriota bacterium]|nr:hypothetical protein [Acidobacteriota bacterium]
MKLQRSLSVLAVFLMTNGTLLGSEPEGVLQVRWGELGKLIGGKKVALQLAKGARVKGRVRRVTEASIVLWVKRSPDYPKGQSEIAREAVSRIEVRSSKKAKPAREVGRISLTGAVFVGALFGSMLGLAGGTFSESEPNDAQMVGSVAIATVAAVLTYRALGPKDITPKRITLIEILPDLPAEESPKPTDKEQSPSPKQDTFSSMGESLPVASKPLILPAFQHNGIGAVVPALVEQSRSERLRRQARRAVMRHDLPLDLSSRPMHAHR